jgi:HEAT repeat protein
VIAASAPRDASSLTDDLLQMADALRKSGDSGAARRVYASVLSGKDATRRYAALYAMYRDGEERDAAPLVAALDDSSPRLRGLALELLSAWKGDDIHAVLASRFQSAKGSQKAAYLRALGARKAANVEKLIEEAARDPDVDVRVTALELGGKLRDASSEPLLLEALAKGSPAVKDIAARACFDLADAKVEKDSAGAVSLYRRLLEATDDPADKGRALIALGRAADATSLPRIDAARKDAALGPSASQAYTLYAISIGKSGKKDEAIAMLQSVLGSGAPRETVKAAIESLKEFGGDPGLLQKKQGFIVAWKIVGPFPNKDGKGFETVYSPEEAVRLDGTQKDERGRDRKWADFVSTSLDGKVDLRQAFQRSNDVCAYAYVELTAPEARDVRFKIGSDDGAACWLNGKKVHANNTIRAWSADEDSADARLEAGANKILLKITQGGGEWEFSFRVTDRKDQPIDLSAFKS